jgi:Ca2+-binding RTX toxin-like protein
MDIAANGQRVRFTRDIGSVAMNLNGVEGINLNALGGADTITINDLSDTDVETVLVNLAGTPGGTTGDAQPDTVILNATDAADSVQAMDFSGEADVIGLSATVRIQAAEGANDQLVVNMLGGPDFFAAAALPAGLFQLTVDRRAGDDFIIGSQGDDVLRGGDGDDFVQGNEGNDLVELGAGEDVYRWTSAAGVGSDTVEGQGGSDLLLFFGSGADENIDISANGGRVRLFRDVAAVSIDLDDVESIALRAYGGADNIVVGDLSGTDETRIDLDLGGPAGGGDGQADTVTVNGTQGADVFGAAGGAGGVTVFGLSATVRIFQQEPLNDHLTLNALGGVDVVDATSLAADGIQLAIYGGLDADVIRGGEGGDLLAGGGGNDSVFGGPGDDVFVWNPGDSSDVVEGQAGSDTLLFNGANVSETMDIAANGQRVRFTRDIANVTMDLDGVEGMDLHASGGADTITVNDLSGTDLTRLNLDLASPAGSGTGDGQADTIIINGTNGADAIVVAGNAGGISVLGLAAQVNITGAESPTTG